eukprot:TRINITY_DN48964_c0_g1_i1.p1 TRINITY_DN48964_c0_g1~~TRINITY_DN48964_c0_g1_i1.p1  ORF type:complete len:107 (+),score=15.30 TRINITY_DN48964_c0_g1_i1:83-403(+)
MCIRDSANSVPAVSETEPRLEPSSASSRTGVDGYARIYAVLEAGEHGATIPGLYCSVGLLTSSKTSPVVIQNAIRSVLIVDQTAWSVSASRSVSYTHLTLPTKRIV